MARRTLAIIGALGIGLGCRGAGPQAGAPAAAEGWAVTAWGERYEVFAETAALVAGQVATSNAHVTVLSGFTPLREGAVSLVLRGSNGVEQVFRQQKPKRDGIYPVDARPASEGTFDLVFRIESPAGPEDVAAGRVRVGSSTAPGGRVEEEGAAADGVSFLKEQQWRTDFATAWVREGALAESVEGSARVRPSRGGEVILTATADASVAASPWPYTGLEAAEGAVLFRLRPRIAGRSVPELQSDAAALESEVGVARARVERLTELLRVEATSQAELERAQAALAGAEARLASARAGVAGASQAAASAEAATDVPVRAPWAGQVAEVFVSPGQTVAAGAALGRLVKPRPLWVAVALRPADAARVRAPEGLILGRPGQQAALQIGRSELRFVSRAPEVDPRTASVDVILEVDRSASELPLGSALEAEIVLSGERRGVVVPLSAILDDSGASVAYVQLDGEAFARREVRVLRRLGTEALVEGLRPGERLVLQGAGAIRRSSLLSAGAPEGHVH